MQNWSVTATVVEQLVLLQMFTMLSKADTEDLMLSAQFQVAVVCFQLQQCVVGESVSRASPSYLMPCC